MKKKCEKRTFQNYFGSEGKMCILDFITNANSSKALSEKYRHYIMNKYKHSNVIYYNENISMMNKGKMRDSLMANQKRIHSFAKNDFDGNTATCTFSSDDRSSIDEDNEDIDSTCSFCNTSSFSFCNTSQKSFK